MKKVARSAAEEPGLQSPVIMAVYATRRSPQPTGTPDTARVKILAQGRASKERAACPTGRGSIRSGRLFIP